MWRFYQKNIHMIILLLRALFSFNCTNNPRSSILPYSPSIMELFRPVHVMDRSQGNWWACTLKKAFLVGTRHQNFHNFFCQNESHISLNSKALLEEDGSVDHNVDVVLRLPQRVVVVVHIHLHCLAQSLHDNNDFFSFQKEDKTEREWERPPWEHGSTHILGWVALSDHSCLSEWGQFR